MTRRPVPILLQISFAAVMGALAGAPAGAADDEELPLGCHDTGIYGDLDAAVRLTLPADLDAAQLSVVIDGEHATLVLYEGAWPVKVYPIGGEGTTELAVGDTQVKLRKADAAELAPLVKDRPARTLALGTNGTKRTKGKKGTRGTKAERLAPGDRDADGIPDPLDVLVGGKKLVANGAGYTQDYFPLSYPGGDAPRDKGSCTDVVVRALRNAGVDLQQELYEDIKRAPKAYPMVKKRDPNIDHRRVRTLLPWFKRHFAAHGVDPKNADDPFRPGDIIFMDTIESRAGADHIGVVSDVRNADGVPLVINNWTDGFSDAEMDLLPYVPVVARFRMK